MASDDERIKSRQRVICPTDGSLYVDIPVIDRITFKAMAEQAQEYRWSIRNSLDNEIRTVHTHRVTNLSDSTQYIDVERIEKIQGKIAANQQQDYIWNFKNFDPPPQPPELIDTEPKHFGVHYVRYYKDNNTSNAQWIDVELIDQCKIKSMAEQAQEYIFYLKHPEPGDPIPFSETEPFDPYMPTVGFCDPDLPLVAEGQAPWRFDPFQNPVNVQWESEATTDVGWAFYIVASTPALPPTWRWRQDLEWGGIQYPPYTFGLPPFFDVLHGELIATWDQYYSTVDVNHPDYPKIWDEYFPELIPVRNTWVADQLNVGRPFYIIRMLPPWEPPPT